MSTYLKCKINESTTASFEGRTTADRPYLVVPTGSQSSQRAYFPLTTDSGVADTRFAIALSVQNNVQPYYIANADRTTTTTREYTSTYYSGTEYVGVNEPVLSSTYSFSANYFINTISTSAANRTTVSYVALVAMDVFETSKYASIITDYISNSHSATFSNGTSSISSSDSTTYTSYKNIVRIDVSRYGTNSSVISDVANTLTARQLAADFKQIACNSSYFGHFKYSQYITSSTYSGYMNTSSRSYPFRRSATTYLYGGSIYTSYTLLSHTSSSSNRTCTVQEEEIITETVTTSITN